MRCEEEYLRVLYFSYFMTKLHLQLILHLYPGDEGALNILLGVAVPDESSNGPDKELLVLFKQLEARQSPLAFCRLQSSVPFRSDAF
jgi:hypothetical protein